MLLVDIDRYEISDCLGQAAVVFGWKRFAAVLVLAYLYLDGFRLESKAGVDAMKCHKMDKNADHGM
jgi:prophage maintenance system killer protein